MKLSVRQLRQLIRESFLEPLTKEKYAYNKNLTRIYQELVEEAIPFENDKKVDEALGDVKVAFDKLKKAVFNSRQGQQLKESFGGRREKFEAWVEDDDATDYVGGDVVMACDPTGGKEELEFIISRLRELDALGGGVEKIYVTGFTN